MSNLLKISTTSYIPYEEAYENVDKKEMRQISDNQCEIDEEEDQDDLSGVSTVYKRARTSEDSVQ